MSGPLHDAMSRALLLATLLTAPAQEKPEDAAAFLKRVEEKAAGGKSLQWKATVKVSADRRELPLAVEAAFKEGNLARLAAKSTDEKLPLEITFTCDGKRASARSSKREEEAADADKEFATALNRILVRGGLYTVNHLKPDAKGADLLDTVSVNDVEFAADEKVGDRRARVLAYQLAVALGPAASVKLWVDAETLAPLKREVRTDVEPQIDETYTSWSPGAEVPASLFELPADSDK